jgi:hypothetical protein
MAYSPEGGRRPGTRARGNGMVTRMTVRTLAGVTDEVAAF